MLRLSRADRSECPGCKSIIVCPGWRSFWSFRVQIVQIVPGADRSDHPGCRLFISSWVQSVPGVDHSDHPRCWLPWSNRNKKTKENVKPFLDFLQQMSIARNNIFNNKLTWKEQISLTHLYFWMKDTFGVFKLTKKHEIFVRISTLAS